MKWYKSLWFKTAIVLFVFSILVFLGTEWIINCFRNQSYGVGRSDWLSALFAWVSALSAIFIGFVAIWQNERFKQESDKNAAKAEREAKAYQNSLLEINNRLIQIEENKELAFIGFLQETVAVLNKDKIITPFHKKHYIAGISEDKKFEKATAFYFGITNQTDIPIKYFQLKDVSICYYNNATKEYTRIANYSAGGYVPSPMINKGEEVTYILVADGIHDVAKNMPKEQEIIINMSLEVESIYGRTVTQEFMLELKKIPEFMQDGKEHLFKIYYFEDNNLVKKEDE